MPFDVAVIRCENYEPATTEAAVEQAFDLLNIDSSLFPEDTLVKFNMLSRREPERAVTTHPSVLQAVINTIKKRAPHTNLSMGDSPGGALRRTESYWKKTGFKAVSEETDVPLISFDDAGSEQVALEGFKNLDSFTISKIVRDAKMIVNVPKLKTHTLTYMTGAMKNLYGVIPGLQKAAIHKALPEHKEFARFLAVLNKEVKPGLHIVDAVIGMEGNGPASGTPRHIGLIIAGTNAVAVDTVAADILGIKPGAVTYINEAARMQLGPASLDEITVKGEAISDVQPENFKLPSAYKINKVLSGIFIKLLRPIIWTRPYVDPELCKRCKQCTESCPVQAMNMHEEGIDIDYKECISCMCCHELCPYKAVKLRFSFLAKFMFNTKDYEQE